MFKNILVPFDLSTQSTRAFKVALDIAKCRDSKVTLLTCLEGDAWHHKYYDARADNELIKKQKKVSKKHLEKLESLAEKNNVAIKSQIITSKSVVNNASELSLVILIEPLAVPLTLIAYPLPTLNSSVTPIGLEPASVV